MSILIVDDDPFFLRLVARQLASLGAEDIACFEGAASALEFLRAQAGTVRLVLCDLQMPGMDGVEMIRGLSAAGYGGALVLVSGEDERILQTAALLAKAHRLDLVAALQKPISTQRLHEMLLQGARPHTAAHARRPDGSYTAEALRTAIAQGELLSHFQPKVSLITGEVVGAESLVRWQHPQDGMVFPDRFIALAEEAGLIDDLTNAVLRCSLRQARDWQDAGLALTVAVNVSMENLVSLDFPEQVAEALHVAGVAPERLVLEVTESRLMKDRVAALDILARLRLKRVGLSIDDFGTGHSTFSQLRDVPFTELKIDRGFVTGAAHDPTRRTIFDASLRAAQQLGLRAVAEGAEDAEDWAFLRNSGCEMVQGYFVARPMPGPELPAWVTGWAERYRQLAATG